MPTYAANPRGISVRQFYCMPVAAACLASVLVMTGCVQSGSGWASAYRPDHADKLAVTMPQNAPSISQEFYRDPAGSGHQGIDIIARIGTPVIAAAAGTVVDSYFEPAYGNRVTIDHGAGSNGYRTITVYKHLHKRSVVSGQRVERGQQIATLGNTGALSGGIPHLHFEVHREIRPRVTRTVDPHTVWLNGTGQVTCFDPAATVEVQNFRSTYPVPCR